MEDLSGWIWVKPHTEWKNNMAAFRRGETAKHDIIMYQLLFIMLKFETAGLNSGPQYWLKTQRSMTCGQESSLLTFTCQGTTQSMTAKSLET